MPEAPEVQTVLSTLETQIKDVSIEDVLIYYPKIVDNVTFKEVLARDIKVMDSTAFSLCKDNDLSILVFDLTDPENIVKAVSGEAIGTLVEN